MIKALLLSLGLGLSLGVPSAGAQEPGDWEARLTEARGSVTLYTSESPEGLPAEPDMPLEAGDRISTGEDGSAEVALDEGAHLISLRPNSDLTLAASQRSATEFNLTLGALLAKIQKLAVGYSMTVRTPAAVAAVRGTEFGVEVSAENPDETHVAVFDEGQVEVAGEAGGMENLISNQETSVLRGRPPMPPYGLRRLVRHRAVVRKFGRRGAYLRKHWKEIPSARRMAVRREMVERMRGNRLKRLEKMKDSGRKGPSEEQRKRVKKSKERMDKARDKALERFKRSRKGQ
jgi:hypothetical protein